MYEEDVIESLKTRKYREISLEMVNRLIEFLVSIYGERVQNHIGDTEGNKEVFQERMNKIECGIKKRKESLDKWIHLVKN